MVDGHEREAFRPGYRLRSGNPDEQGTHQAWPLGDSNAVDSPERHVSRLERGAHDRPDQLEVTARRDLRDDSPKARVEVRLRRDDRREHAPVGRHDGGGRLVTRGLEREDHEARSLEFGSRHMISASSRLSV
jgi:hypothetical protein